MNEFGVIFAAEISRRIKSRPFLVATLLGAVLVAFLASAPTLFGAALSGQSDTIVLAGPAYLRVPAAALLGKDFHIKASVDTLPAKVTTAYLDEHGKAGAVVLLSNRGGRLHLDVFARDLSVWDSIEFAALAPLSVQVATGQPIARTRDYLIVARTLHGLDSKFADSASANLAHAIAIGLVTILYLSIIMTSQSIVSAVAEEKTNRIAELLVATISPVNLLTAKTLSAVTLALLQIAVWFGTAALIIPNMFSKAVGGGSGSGGLSLAVPPETLIAFVVFFILGFLQYATLYAAAASLISRTEDLGSVSGPIVLPVVAGFLIAQFALINPNAPFVIVFSMVPFISPFVMFTRMALETVPQWQVVVSIAINAVTAALAFYVAGKVYRVGMLLYGKLPSLRQVIAVIRT